MIIKSILDTDLYKFTTSYAYMKLFPQAVGTFEFKDRDNTEYTEEFVEQLRIELYNLASIHKGLVMSTDNQTEYQLGFWTIHGDVGDFDPIQDLWKTEVYELARWLVTRYQNIAEFPNRECWENRAWKAIVESIKLIPTDGLGISNSDLEQIGAKDYATVDDILQTATNNIFDSTGRWVQPLMEKYSEDVVVKVLSRHVASEFKRKKAPIYIPRKEYEND